MQRSWSLVCSRCTSFGFHFPHCKLSLRSVDTKQEKEKKTKKMKGPTPKILFENHRVCVSDIRLQKGEAYSRVMKFPTVRWQVDEGIDKSIGRVADKQVFFQDPDTSCDLCNAAVDDDSVFRQVWFELKQPPRRSEEQTKEILKRAIYTTDVGTELLFENRWCRVWDFK